MIRSLDYMGLKPGQFISRISKLTEFLLVLALMGELKT